MKVNKRKNKRKPSSYYYRKWGYRRVGNDPLSELLLIGSYKKRITDLSRNNNLLSSALQESLVESAHLNNLLKSYAKDYNQILFARIKLNDMARNLAKFATDLEEVQNCLAIELPAEYNFFQKKKLSNEKIVKVPDVSCIDEAPELSEDEVEACENVDVCHSNVAENIAPVIHDVHMTPPLYDADDEGIQKKNSNVVYKGSLTPQLDIDLTFVNSKRSTRSKRKSSSLGKKNSSGRLVTRKNSVSSPLLPQVQDSIETNRISSKGLSPVCNSKENFEEMEVPLQNPFNNCIDCIKDCSVVLSSDLIIQNENSVLNDDLNQSPEINEKSCHFQPLNEECNTSFATNHKNESEIHKSIEEINENCDELSVNLENESQIHKSIEEIDENCDELSPEEKKTSIERNSKKLFSISQNASSSLSEKNEYDEEIQNVGSLTFCDSDDDADGEGKNKVSSVTRTSRSKKPLSYAEFFYSDESDIDSPFREAVTKRKSSKKIKLNSASNGNLSENAAEVSDDDVAAIFKPDYSVYNLDVSDSKAKGKKSRKKISSLKSKSKKKSDVSKPLFQKCSVTKLKGGEHRFNKSEAPLELKSIGKHAQKLLQNSCSSPGGILKKAQSSTSKTCEDGKNETPPNDTVNIKDVQSLKRQSMLQTPKRVSFAPTDLVCNFEKMSVSKKIADNKKVRRTSKSAADLAELFSEDQISPVNTELFDEDQLKISSICAKLFNEDESEAPPTETNIPPRINDVQKSNNSVLFDFSEDTEMYTFTIPLNMQSLPSDNDASLKPPSSPVSEQTKPINNIKNEMDMKKSPETLPKSPKNIKKLSLKENKIIRNSLSQDSLDEAEIKAAILLVESPVSFLKQPKRKSLFKELPDDYLKENSNFDLPVSEKKDSLDNKTQTCENSSLSTLTVGIKKSSSSKCQITVRSKSSTKKTKIKNLEKKSLEQSPKLIDATNVIASTNDGNSRRRSKQVCYKEPSLMKKLRRQ